MKGSAAGVSRLPLCPFLHARRTLTLYNSQLISYSSTIAHILHRPHPFLRQRKCEQPAEWLEQYFPAAKAHQEVVQLTEYYRYYKHSPLLVDPSHLDFMITYWNRKKTIYYRKVKRELQIDDCPSEETVEQHVQPSEGMGSQQMGTFQLPSQLRPIEVIPPDPDATIRKLLTHMTKKQYKSTREGSKVLQFQQKSGKSPGKVHLRTNPSHLISTSSFKRTKKKQQHKSLSSEHRKSQTTKDKKLNSIGSCKKISLNQPQTTLNYQRRNKHKQSQTNISSHNNNNRPREQVVNCKKREVLGKGRSSEKSQGAGGKSKSGKKGREAQTSANVKAAIDKVKDRIKAQKNVMLKKYVQSRQSHTKSIDSTQGQTAKRQRK